MYKKNGAKIFGLNKKGVILQPKQNNNNHAYIIVNIAT